MLLPSFITTSVISLGCLPFVWGSSIYTNESDILCSTWEIEKVSIIVSKVSMLECFSYFCLESFSSPYSSVKAKQNDWMKLAVHSHGYLVLGYPFSLFVNHCNFIGRHQWSPYPISVFHSIFRPYLFLVTYPSLIIIFISYSSVWSGSFSWIPKTMRKIPFLTCV